MYRDRYLALLDSHERTRYECFYFERDRHTYLAAHALLRLALSDYAPVAPQAWAFCAGPYGKPRLASTHAARGLYFSLSHTASLVSCAVTVRGECGVDVEAVRPVRQSDAVAQDLFTDEEQADLRRENACGNSSYFFDLWTLKEAYLKALGSGFSGNAREVSFSLTDGTVRAQSISGQWCFHLQRLGQSHRLALAVRASPPCRVRLREIVLGCRGHAAPRATTPTTST